MTTTRTDGPLWAAALFGCVILASCATIEEDPVVLQVVGYGILENEGVTLRTDETSSIGAKRVDGRGLRIATTTDRVPLRPGLSYGIAFRVFRAPWPEVPIKAVLRTSASCVLKTSGEVVHHNDSLLKVKVGQLRHIGMRIPASDSENPCLGDPGPGTDTLELYFGERKLAEKRFEVYRE
jgi:hypothetical protein